MAAPKKGQGITFQLPARDAVPTPKEEKRPTPAAGTRTGLGMVSKLIAGVHQDGEEVTKLQGEVERLKLQIGEQLLDPKEIKLTRWADRHPDSFESEAFRELKKEIENAGGNVQPIKVRLAKQTDEQAKREGLKYELIYGSRRTRACLELGLRVRAVVDEEVDDHGLYVQMQRENRGRANLSAWEQGASYQKAIEEGLFSSARQLAEQIGMDHGNVSKAMRIAALPAEIVGAFTSPIEIQFRWAIALDKAYQKDRDKVLAAARKVKGETPRAPAAEVFKRLVEATGQKANGSGTRQARTFDLENGATGSINTDKTGAVTVQLAVGSLPESEWEALEAGLKRLLGGLKTGV